VKALAKTLLTYLGYTISRTRSSTSTDTSSDPRAYNQDGLWTVHNHDFMTESRFAKAYERGCLADSDHRIHWRVHVAIWSAVTALRLPGDFVECGVNKGFLSSAIMEYTHWNTLNKTFYLLDTFAGLNPRYSSDAEMKNHEVFMEKSYYTTDASAVVRNFSEWQNVRIIQGTVPETLPQITSQAIAYLHLDMNCAEPELAAIEFLWERLVPGAMVLFDDYAYSGYEAQKHALDNFVNRHGLLIASLPTGQGLLVRP
jgi:Macrocin-O-methyltransferase (TylF)